MKLAKKEKIVPIKKPNDVYYNDVYSKFGYIWEEGSDGKSDRKVARDIRLTGIYRDIDTQQVYYTLEFEYKGLNQTQEVSREILTSSSKLLDLGKYGADIIAANTNVIIKHLHNQETKLPVSLVHTHMGWGKYDEKLIFKHYKAIGLDSVYRGHYAIEPAGNFKVWRQMVKETVLGNTNLELAIVLGLSAAVVGLLSQMIAMETLLIHIYGDSSQGKTTATSLAISTFGNPNNLVKNSLLSTWLATDNAIIANLNGNYGVPVAFDELSMSQSMDFSAIIYSLAGGRDKARMNKDAELKETGSWVTTILSTGEFALSSKTKGNTGIKIRLIELDNVPWTKDAQSADEIKRIAFANYGQAGPRFVKKLMELGSEAVFSKWKLWAVKIRKEMVNSRLADRAADKLAILMVTSEIAKIALKLDFGLDKMMEFLIENEKKAAEERDIGLRAYNFFLDIINSNFRKFEPNKRVVRTSGSELVQKEPYEWGLIEKKKDFQVVYVIPTKFEGILKEGNFEDSKTILKRWKELGLLDCDSDRYTRKRKVNTDTPVPVYGVILKNKDSEEADLGDAFTLPATSKKRRV